MGRVLKVEVTDDTLSIDLEDGRAVSVPIGWYPRLANGTPSEPANLQISGAGYGIPVILAIHFLRQVETLGH